MAILLTRPQADSERIAEDLRSRGIDSLIWPLSRIVRLADRTDITDSTDALIFTSANAVRAFADLSDLRDIPALCVGGRTARVAHDCGFANITDADGDAGTLLEIAAASAHRRFHYPRGRETVRYLATELRAHGKGVTEQVLYGSDPAGPPGDAVDQALCTGRIAAITVWSRRNATLLAKHLGKKPAWQIRGTDLVAISQFAAEPLQNAEFRRILVAAAPNARAMVETISAALRQ